MLKAGDTAPLDTTVLGPDGEKVKLKDKTGKFIVLYFYPRDNTPGCTKEACSFRDNFREMQDLGAEVIGVSKDSIDSHQTFTKKYKLPFTLWSDPEHKLMEAFGVWQEKSMFGKKYMGVERATFIIDPQGKIKEVWPKVKPAEHGEEVLKVLRGIIQNS